MSDLAVLVWTGRPRVARGCQSRPCRLLEKPQPPRASIRRQPSAAEGVLLGRSMPGIERRPQCCSAPEGPAVVLKGSEGASPRSLVFRTQHSCVASVSGLGPCPRSGMGARGLQRRPGALRGSARWRAGPQGRRAFVAALPSLSGRFGFISRCGKNGIK